MATKKIPPPQPSEVMQEALRAVMGDEDSSWPVDSTYPPTGNLEADYQGGDRDKQMLLWAIYIAVLSGKPVPAWAAQAFHQVMEDMVTGKSRSWEDAFGPIRGKAKKRRVQPRGLQTTALMFEVRRHVDQRDAGSSVDDAVASVHGVGQRTAYRLLRRSRKKAGSTLR